MITTENVAKGKFEVIDLVYTALCAVLIVVCSWISIPTTVPFTLQTFAVFMALELLGGKRGTMAVIVYILLGAIGLPVFSGFKAGIGVLLGTTGGYILGFIITGLVYMAFEKLFGDKRVLKIIALVIGLALCYLFGTVWFMKVYAANTGEIGIMTALGWCVFPFIIPDLLKMALAITLAGRIKKHVKI